MRKVILTLLYIALLVGCGGGSKNDSLPVIYEVEDVNIAASSSNIVRGKLTDSEGKSEGYEFVIIANPANGTLELASDGSFVYTPNEDANGTDQFTYSIRDGNGRSNIGTVKIEITIVSACLETRETLLSTEFKIDENQTAAITTIGEQQQAAGFVVEMSAYQFHTSARQMLNTIVSRISNEVASVNTISERKALSNVDSISGQYRLTYSFSSFTTTSTVDLNNTLYEAVSNDSSSELSPPEEDAIEASSFRLWVTVLFNDEESVLVVLGLVPEDSYSEFVSILDAYADGGNIALCGSEISSNKDQFVAEEVGSNLADFLFVVDNSGSMGAEQSAVREAADIFANTIEGAGLDYQIAVITTDNDQLRGSGFTSDIDSFKSDIVAGTFGSGTETGIYFAERALFSTSLGDAIDGTVTTAGYPRENAALSVIILSDERSQYNSRGFTSFDVDENLFVERNYRVYSIVNEFDAARSQYDDLAFSSGGAVASISDTSSFPAIMEQIATNSGGASSRYVLTGKPVSSTIEVRVDGSEVIRSKNDGWQYIALSNTIVFYGDAIPSAGSAIVVEYSSILESNDITE